MTEKLVPIGNHKDRDMRLVRKKLLEIIEDVDSKAKDVTDASKLLARMHKALAPEKITTKVSDEDRRSQEELTDADKKVIDDALT